MPSALAFFVGTSCENIAGHKVDMKIGYQPGNCLGDHYNLDYTFILKQKNPWLV